MLVENPPNYGAVRILVMWKDPGSASLRQNISLGVQQFAGSVEAYARATGRELNGGAIRPTRYRDAPLACAAGPARMLVYDTRSFGFAGHFEQILIKRASDVYVATYTRGADQPENRAAAAALREICR